MDGERTADAINEVAGAAKSTIKETIGQGVENASATLARAGAAAAQAGAAIGDAASRAGEQARGAAAEVSQRGSAVAQYLSETATARPMTALLVAAAAGYGLARMIRWR
jgi:hypothetical protein